MVSTESRYFCLDSMEQFSQYLANILKKPLPGQEAQKKMMPKLGKAFDRFSIEAREGAKEGAVLLLLYKKNGSIYFPLTQRHEYNGAHSGQISFPGGKVEANDLSPVHTALRETEEELGIAQSSVQVLGKLTDLFIIASNFNVRPVVGFLEEPPKFNLDSREVAEVIEISIEQLLDSTLIKEKEIKARQKYFITAPYFDFDGYHVWGATAMMLAEFKEIVRLRGLK